MERGRVAAGEGTNQRADAVRVAHGERTVLQQAAYFAEYIGCRAGGLKDEPLVVVLLHQRIAARQLGGNACGQRGQGIRHVIGFVVLLADQRVRQLCLTKRQIAQAGIAQGTFTDIRMFHPIPVQLVGVVNGEELICQFGRQRAGQRFTHGDDGNRVDDVK